MIADMMATRAAEVTALTSVRPVVNARRDAYPHAVYETDGMRGKGYLNCASAQQEGTVRFFIAGHNAAEVNANVEAVKDKLIGWTATGSAYRIRRILLADESDIYEDRESDPKHYVYVKSIDFAVKALKL